MSQSFIHQGSVARRWRELPELQGVIVGFPRTSVSDRLRLAVYCNISIVKELFSSAWARNLAHARTQPITS